VSSETQVRFPEYQEGTARVGLTVKVGVVQMGRVNDQMDQGVFEEMTFQFWVKGPGWRIEEPDEDAVLWLAKMENLRASTADSPPVTLSEGYLWLPLPPFIIADVVDDIAPFLLYLFNRSLSEGYLW